MTSSPGGILKSAREARGLSVAQVAETLCLMPRYLEAIESDDLARLPGVFFYKAFVTQYARALGVPTKKLQPALDAFLAPLAPPPPVVEPEPPTRAWAQRLMALLPSEPKEPTGPETGLRPRDPIVSASNHHYLRDRRFGASAAAFASVLICCSAFYAWWNKPPQISTSSASQTAPVQPKAPSSSTPVASSSQQSNTTTDATSGAVRTVAVSAQDGTPQHVELSLEATEKVWLQVTSGGKVVFSGILQPSERKSLAGIGAAQLKIGNAGGVAVNWKGRQLGPIGPSGQVRTVVLKEDKNIEILEPGQPSPEI